MNTIDITSTRENAINLTTPNIMSAANTVISGNIDDSTELIDNISADGNGDRRNHTSRQEWSNPRVSGQGAYRTTDEKATVDTQHKPVEIQTRHASNLHDLIDKCDKNPSCGKTQATDNDNMEGNTLIVTPNAELNAHESAADHQQAPEITETGAADGIGRDFLANTSIIPNKEEKTRPKEMRNTIEINNTQFTRITIE